MQFSNAVAGEEKSTVAKLIRVITCTKQMSWYSRILESKGSLGLVGSNASGNLDYIVIKLSTNMIKVAKDKSFLRIESTGNDILCVLACKLSAFLDSQGRLEQVLFIICSHKKSESLAYICARQMVYVVSFFTSKLNDERYIKDLLQPLAEHKWDQMAKMHGRARGTTSSIQEERLLLLITIENASQLSATWQKVNNKTFKKTMYSLNHPYLCEKKIPLRKKMWGFLPVSFSSLCSISSSMGLVPNCSISLL